jgi:hypothetical protein
MARPDLVPAPAVSPLIAATTFVFNPPINMLPKSTARNLVAMSGYSFLAVHLWLTVKRRPAFVTFFDQYALFVSIPMNILAGFDRWVLSDSGKYVRDGETTPIAEQKGVTLWQRYKWAFNFSVSARGAGWNWKVKNVPQGLPKGYPRW